MKAIKTTFSLLMLAINALLILVIKESTDKSISELQQEVDTQLKSK